MAIEMNSTASVGKVVGGYDAITTFAAAEPEENALQINQDDKFYNRLLSKESSAANPSLRDYYAVAPAAVPFTWESAPGTPKNTAPASALPPLTPPPSYQLRLINKSRAAGSKKQFRFLGFAIPGVFFPAAKKTHSAWLSSSSLSSSSDSSCVLSPTRRRRRASLSPAASIPCFGMIPRLMSSRGQ